MKGKKPKAFALLLDDADKSADKSKRPARRPPDEPDGDEPEYDAEDDFASDDASDEAGDDDMGEPGEAGDDMASDIDPEQRHLAEQLGFTEPDQQRALIDLIKSVTGSASAPGSSTSSAGGSLPPEGY